MESAGATALRLCGSSGGSAWLLLCGPLYTTQNWAGVGWILEEKPLPQPCPTLIMASSPPQNAGWGTACHLQACLAHMLHTACLLPVGIPELVSCQGQDGVQDLERTILPGGALWGERVQLQVPGETQSLELAVHPVE
jgi:hypothetical protein